MLTMTMFVHEKKFGTARIINNLYLRSTSLPRLVGYLP